MTTPMPPPLTLVPPGPREVADAAKAHAYIDHWKALLDAHEKSVRVSLGLNDDTDPLPPGTVLCNAIRFSDKSYKAEAAVIIASFLTRGDRPLADDITTVGLDDVIAGRPEDEALQVLQTLCDAFRSSKLISVDLSDNALGSKGISACRTVLAGQAGSLRRISLCNNGLSRESMAEVADFLTSNGSGENVAAASDSGCIAENLEKIHFFNNMSGDGGCHSFANILNRCGDRLVDVRFSGTRAGREGSMVVASALDGMGDRLRNLVRIDLADNTFGIEGAGHLSHMFARCPNLTHVNLQDCMCEDAGLKPICHALWSSDACLEELNVSGNEITKRCGKPIAELLEENNTTVKVFSAEDNELTSLGVQQIVRALVEGDGECVVENINLKMNEIGRIGAAAILDAYGPGGGGMPNLQIIALDNNFFSEEDVEALEGAFGEKLLTMEENDDEEDIDDQLSDDEDEEDDEDEDDVGHTEDADVDALTAGLAGATLDHDLT